MKRRIFDRKNNQGGFTIIELTVAAAVFSVIMLMVAGIIVRFTNSFQKGVIESTTQNVARNVMDTVTEAIQNGKKPNGPRADGSYCVGTTRYEVRLNTPINDNPGSFALRETKGAGNGCPTGAVGAGPQELLGRDMRLFDFDISPMDGSEKLWRVSIMVGYGIDDDLFDFSDPDLPRCRQDIGFRFCAVRELTSTVKPWITSSN